jgi:adenylate kinase family enzyme
MQPITVAFFGISGSGKGTQCELLEKFLREKDSSRGVVRPEMGNLLRQFMQTGTPMAAHVKHILETGGLVPSFMPINLLTTELNRSFDGTQHVILDGTCRRPDQSRAADDIMRMFGRESLHVVTLNLTPGSAKKRLELRGRFDDAKDEVIASRFAWYEEQVVPAMKELQQLGWHLHEIDGEPDVETIHKNILTALGLA